MTLIVTNDAVVIEQHFNAAMSSILRCFQSETVKKIGVAYSGGVDSSVLLQLTQKFCLENGVTLYAFHVHHGLSKNADAWLQHCADTCKKNQIFFHSKYVQVEKNSAGIEATARGHRYRALGDMCRETGVQMILTGHHLEDQAETILMQLLRGSGLQGIAGMDDVNYAPTLTGNLHLQIARPLLPQTKKNILHYAALAKVDHIHDESNIDPHFTRNALRISVMPVIDKILPGFASRLSRTSTHVRSASRLLAEIANTDIKNVSVGEQLCIEKMLTLSNDRIDNLMRYWLSVQGAKMPSSARFKELRRQLLQSSTDARVTLLHDGLELHRYKNKIWSVPQVKAADAYVEAEFVWQGEASVYLPEFKGHLQFVPSERGVNADWLLQKRLVVKKRHGGERLRLATNRPSRDIKSHFQSFQVPFWRRAQLPFVYIEKQLFFVADIGLDAAFLDDTGKNTINIIWQPE